MAITDRDRRLLWARAHNRCAYCRKALTRDASTAGGDVVVADEAHIIARAPDGPRGLDGDRTDVDGYDNLILLCKNDHKMIDDLPRKYPVERLLQMKREHEAWAESRFENEEAPRGPDNTPLGVVATTDEDSIPFTVISSGAELWVILDGAVQCNIGFSGPAVDGAKTEIANHALASLQEWSEVSEEVKDGGYRAITRVITAIDVQLSDLWKVDLFLLARALPRRLEGGVGAPVPWKVAQLIVHTADDLAELQREHSQRPPRSDSGSGAPPTSP